MTPPSSGIERIGTLIDGLVNRLAIVLFVILFAAVLAQILLRYVFGNPLTWSEELSRYLFIWIALLGWTLASRNRTHIAVRLFLEMMPPAMRLGVEILNAGLVALFAVLLAILGTKLAISSGDVPTITLFFTFGVVYAAVPVAACLLILQAVRDVVRLWRGFRQGATS